MSDTVPEIVDSAGAAAAAKAKARKRLMILGAAAAALLLGGGSAGYMMLAGDGSPHAEAAEGDGSGAGGHGVVEATEKYIDMPPMVVNLRSPDGRARFLKVHLMLVPGPKGTESLLKRKLPAILDAYQPFLRELRPEDLAGSAAVFRIKEELLSRTASALGPDVVQDILIQDLVQQ